MPIFLTTTTYFRRGCQATTLPARKKPQQQGEEAGREPRETLAFVLLALSSGPPSAAGGHWGHQAEDLWVPRYGLAGNAPGPMSLLTPHPHAAMLLTPKPQCNLKMAEQGAFVPLSGWPRNLSGPSPKADLGFPITADRQGSPWAVPSSPHPDSRATSVHWPGESGMLEHQGPHSHVPRDAAEEGGPAPRPAFCP